MLTRCLAFVRGLLRRRTIDAEVAEELHFHLEQEIQAHLDRGVPPAEARRLAALSLGGVTQITDAVRDLRTTRAEVLWREVRQGVRTLCAAPAFTVPAALVLALGVGGTTAVFSVLDGVLLRPLPYPNAAELVRVWSRNDERQVPFLSVSPADYEDWRARASVVQIAAYERPRVLLSRAGAEPVTVMSVTTDLFTVLGAAPATGRGFHREDEAAAVAAVVSHQLAESWFGGAAESIGRSLTAGDDAWTIVGVMPHGFEVPTAPADVWVPLATNVADGTRFAHTLRVVGRAKPTADLSSIRRDLEAVAAQLALERPAANRGWSVTVLPLFDIVVSPEFRRSLWIVAGAVMFVLMMASTSAAGLFLARASTRRRELAVRVALGASRGSLVRLLLLECLVLSAASGVMGLMVAYWGIALLQAIGGATVPRLDQVAPSARVFGCAAVSTLLAALVAGVLPAWRSTRSLHDMLRSRGDASEPSSARALHLLVVLEVTSAVLLVIGAALLVQTVVNLQSRRLGFDPGGVVTVNAVWPSAGETDLVGRTEAALSSVMTLQGVTDAAAVNAPPFSGGNSGNTFTIEGRNTPEGALPDADYRVVSPAYFKTMRIPVRRGRPFVDADVRTRGAVIISETAERRFWPDGDALGRRLKIGRSDWLTIVGIVGDARYLSLDDPGDSVRPMLYVPHGQMPSTPMTIVLRSSLPLASLAGSIRRTMTAGGTAGITGLQTMDAMLREASVAQRFSMSLVTVFAVAAVTLAIVGLYGLLAFLVARRTKEIGVRIALGAGHLRIIRLVLGRTLALVGAGIAAGFAVSLGLGGVLGSLLFGVSARDPLTYAAVAAGFTLLGVAVGTLPTLRALRTDPVSVIRME
jgi:predicted permease